MDGTRSLKLHPDLNDTHGRNCGLYSFTRLLDKYFLTDYTEETPATANGKQKHYTEAIQEVQAAIHDYLMESCACYQKIVEYYCSTSASMGTLKKGKVLSKAFRTINKILQSGTPHERTMLMLAHNDRKIGYYYNDMDPVQIDQSSLFDIILRAVNRAYPGYRLVNFEDGVFQRHPSVTKDNRLVIGLTNADEVLHQYDKNTGLVHAWHTQDEEYHEKFHCNATLSSQITQDEKFMKCAASLLLPDKFFVERFVVPETPNFLCVAYTLEPVAVK